MLAQLAGKPLPKTFKDKYGLTNKLEKDVSGTTDCVHLQEKLLDYAPSHLSRGRYINSCSFWVWHRDR